MVTRHLWAKDSLFHLLATRLESKARLLPQFRQAFLIELIKMPSNLDLMADGAHRVLGFWVEKSGVVAVH